MKREIKFRVWDKKSKHMIMNPLNFPTDYPLNDLRQYTGLEDKNEKEIYGGDICRVFNSKTREYEIGIVKMSGLGCWSFKIGNLLIPIFKFIDSQLSIVHDFSRIEIIGIIYENLELKKQS